MGTHVLPRPTSPVFVLDFPPSKFCPPCHPVNAFVPLPAASIFTSPQLGQYQPSECLEEDAKTTRRKSSKLCLATKRKRKKNMKTLRSMTTKKETRRKKKRRKWKERHHLNPPCDPILTTTST